MSVCAWCRKIKNDKGFWQKPESNLKNYSEQCFSHCICNVCAQKEYPDLYQDIYTVKK